MSESPNTGSSDPSSGEGGSQKSRDSNKGRVVTYLTILFVAAFILLLMTFLMQQRSNQETIDGLTQSLNTLHSTQNLVETNQNLIEENARLKAAVSSLEELHQTHSVLTKEADALKDQVAAMQYFWQIDEAYVKGRYSLCRSLIEEMEAQPTQTGGDKTLSDLLPTENTTGTKRFSPSQRYAEIYEAVNETPS